MQLKTVPLLFVAASLAPAAGAQSALYTFAGDAANDAAGQSVAFLPDVDGDGVADVAIGMPGDDADGASSDEGSVSIHSGKTGALLRKIFGPGDGSRFGATIATVADADGDGRTDLLVGAPYRSNVSHAETGAAFVHSTSTGAKLREYYGSTAHERLGLAVADVGDANGDGVRDYAIGAPYYDSSLVDAGIVRVYSGVGGAFLDQLVASYEHGLFGYALAGAGDYDGDGHDDWIAGSPNFTNVQGVVIGRAVVVSGRTGNLLDAFYGSEELEYCGRAVAGLGDLDGDGRSEVAVGSPYFDGGPLQSRGRARVFRGGTGALLAQVVGTEEHWRIGWSLGAADGFVGSAKSLAIGAPGFEVTNVGILGAVRFHDPLTGSLQATVLGDEDQGWYGAAIDASRDLNGDGHAELLVGATTEGAHGVARLLLGDTTKTYRYGAAKTTSQGCVPVIEANGAASLSLGNNFHVTAREVHPQTTGMLLWSRSQASTPLWGGTLLVGAPIQRTALQNAGSSWANGPCSGTFDFHFHQTFLTNVGLVPGTTVYAQYWFRDGGFPVPSNVGLSRGLAFEVAP